MSGKLLLIYICNFHVLSNLLLFYICKLHWNLHATYVKNMLEEAKRRKTFLAEKWRKRIKGCKSTGRAAIGVWKNLLDVRRMVLSEREDLDTWLEFASLCRHGGNLSLAERVLRMSQPKDSSASSSSSTYSSYLAAIPSSASNSTPPPLQPLSLDRSSSCGQELNPYFTYADNFRPTSLADCKIRFAVLRQRWSMGQKFEAMGSLKGLIEEISNSSLDLKSSKPESPSYQSSSALYLDCLLKLGQWKLSILDPGTPVDIDTRKEVLALYAKVKVF